MEHIHFSRQHHALESLVLGDSPEDLEHQIEQKRHELVEFFHTNPVMMAVYGHAWNDRRGVDFTIASNTLNLVREMKRFNEQFQKHNRIVVVLIGYDYRPDTLELWEHPEVTDVVELHPVDVNPLSLGLDEAGVGVPPDSIFATQLQPAANREEYERIVTRIAEKVCQQLQDLFQQYPGVPVYTSFHNADTSILPHVTGLFQLVGKWVKQMSEAQHRVCCVEHYSHDLLEEHGPVRQRAYLSIADFLLNVEEGLFWHFDDPQKAYLYRILEQIEQEGTFPELEPNSDLARVMELLSWAKRPGESLDAIVTINALNSAALGGVVTQVDPLPYDFVSTTPLTEMSYEAISYYFGERTRTVLGLAPDDSQEAIRQKIIAVFRQSVQSFFEQNGYTYHPEQGLFVQFIRSDARKNLGMDILLSELLEVNSVNTKTGYLPEERSFDGTVFLIWKNVVKDFGFSVSYGYGWDFEQQQGHITGNDSMRTIEEGRPVEWSRVDVLAILAEMAKQKTLTGSNFASIQEGFGMNFLENVWYEVPFITYEKSASLKIYFKEVLGIDLAPHGYADWDIRVEETALAPVAGSSLLKQHPVLHTAKTYRQAALDYIMTSIESYKHAHSEARTIMEEDPQFNADLASKIAPPDPYCWGQPMQTTHAGTGFSGLDIATQAAYLLWVKDHAAALKEERYADIEALKQKLDSTRIHAQRSGLLYHPDMSGILTGLRFLPHYQEILKRHSDLGPYTLRTMDTAIKILAQG